MIVLISCFLLTSFKPLVASDNTSLVEFTKADKKMMKTYNKVLKKYASDKNFIHKFVMSQTAWKKYSEAYIESLYPQEDKRLRYGGIYSTCYSLNMTSLIEERTKQIKHWVVGTEEGDVCAGSVRVIH